MFEVIEQNNICDVVHCDVNNSKALALLGAANFKLDGVSELLTRVILLHLNSYLLRYRRPENVYLDLCKLPYSIKKEFSIFNISTLRFKNRFYTYSLEGQS